MASALMDTSLRPNKQSLSFVLARRILAGLESLFIFGALGLVAFGTFLQHELGRTADGWLWLWLAGALMIYNLDRLHPDPADAINLPNRPQWRKTRKTIIGLSVVTLIWLPLWWHDGWLLVGIFLAAPASAAYVLPIPILGKRVKDLPIWKETFPALVILGALFFPIFGRGETRLSPARWIGPGAWALLALLINLLLSDLRDRAGDYSTQVRTAANQLSSRAHRRLLWSLLAGQILAALLCPQPFSLLGLSVYLGVLIWLADRPRPHWFYAWLVDGMLFIPLLQSFLSRAF